MIRVPINRDRLCYLLRPSSFGRFLIVGGINTLIGIGSFPYLYWILFPKLDINTLLFLGWAICTAFAFCSHKYVTFKSKGAAHREGIKFVIQALVILGINILVVNAVTHFTKFSPVVAQILLSVLLAALLMILNFLGLNHLVFKQRR